MRTALAAARRLTASRAPTHAPTATTAFPPVSTVGCRGWQVYIVLFPDPRQIGRRRRHRPNSLFPPVAEFFSRLQVLIHFFSLKYGLRPARTGHHVQTFDQFFNNVHTTAQAETDNTDRQQQHRRQRRCRHGGGATLPSAAAAVAAAALRWCSQYACCACQLHLQLSCCEQHCACACGCGCGPRQLLHRCPLRTEKRKLPELTCELGLSPPGARTRAEP